MKMYFLLKMKIFQPAMLVYQRVTQKPFDEPSYGKYSLREVMFGFINSSLVILCIFDFVAYACDLIVTIDYAFGPTRTLILGIQVESYSPFEI